MKKLITLIMLFGALLCLAGCQSPEEKAFNQIKNTKITVDQTTVDQVQQGIDSFKNGK